MSTTATEGKTRQVALAFFAGDACRQRAEEKAKKLGRGAYALPLDRVTAPLEPYPRIYGALVEWVVVRDEE
jgi:hypothetical protein